MRRVDLIFLIFVATTTAVFSQTPTPVPTPTSSPAAPAYWVIVHPRNVVTAVNRKFLEDVFLKRRTAWGSGQKIFPVDLATSSPVRHRFSQDAIDRPVSAVKSYWQRLIFSGRDVPPPELDTEQQVIAYVRRTAGAIGYVSSDAELTGVKTVPVK